VSCHSVFGELVEGLDVQDSISNVKVVNPRARNHKPVEDVVLEKVNIIRKGKEARKFDAPKVFEENMPKVEANFKSIREEEKKKAEAKAKVSKEEFIKVNETIKDKLIKSETGIELAYLKKGEGAKPTADQKVKIECAGHFEDGELFWTTWKDVAKKYGKYDPVQDQRGGYQAFTQPYNQTATLIAGFKEALLKMNIGDKVRVFIPYHLGYGENGSPPVIPGKTDLVFDIELKEIVQ
jgi:FKBP-type peptidyl-prolyl cis-trans isomerase